MTIDDDSVDKIWEIVIKSISLINFIFYNFSFPWLKYDWISKIKTKFSLEGKFELKKNYIKIFVRFTLLNS